MNITISILFLGLILGLFMWIKYMVTKQQNRLNAIDKKFTHMTLPSDTKKSGYPNPSKSIKKSINPNTYKQQIIEYFKVKGYRVAVQNSVGIDLVLKKGKEIAFVKVVYNSVNNKKIYDNDFKIFVGEVTLFIEENPVFSSDVLKRYYITSSEFLDESASFFLHEHKGKVVHYIIPIKE